MNLGRRVRSAGLALVSAAIVVLLFTVSADRPLVRGLETASLDLRFRLRGLRPPGPEVSLILVDERSLESLGRWPFSRALFARALEVLDHAGAKVVAFDFLFTEPDEPVPADLRMAQRAPPNRAALRLQLWISLQRQNSALEGGGFEPPVPRQRRHPSATANHLSEPCRPVF